MTSSTKSEAFVINRDTDSDTITCNAGSDTLSGNLGDDTLDGGNGSDVINGGSGVDTFTGGNGADTLDRGSGVDTLTSGAGNDTLSGASETDTFVFNFGAAFGTDTIDDFETDDLLMITGSLTAEYILADILAQQAIGIEADVLIGSLDGVSKIILERVDFEFTIDNILVA